MRTSSRQLSSQLRNAAFRLNRRVRSEMADGELTDAQFTILAILSLEGPHTLSALAEREGISAASLSRTVSSLGRRGYILRIDNADDGRKVDIHATPEGASVVGDTVVRRERWLAERLETLSDADRAAIARAATLMVQMADQ